MGKVEKLQELLGQNCAGGYSNGFIGEANANWCEDNYPEIVVVSDVYRVGKMACLLRSVDEDTPGLDELIEVLEGLNDYPLIDDEYLSSLVAEDEGRVAQEYADEWELPVSCVWDALWALQTGFDWEQDYAYYAGDVDELKVKALEFGQTWDAHYNSGMSHHPEVCKYCEDAEVK